MLADCLIVGILGLIFGSFSTALIHRIPLGLPWSHGPKSAYRSACTSCGAKLKPLDLIPVFSWLFLRGKCRSCKAPIGFKYPLTELGVVAACLGVYAVFGLSAQGLIIMAAVPFFVALLVIDLDHMILPNQLVVIVGVLALLRLALVFVSTHPAVMPFAVEYIGGALVYGGVVWLMGWVMTKLLKKDSLGFGDVKFFVVAGLWLGLSALAWFCMLAGFLGIVLGIVWQAVKKERIFPFGPALILALYVLLLLDGSLLL